MWRRLSTAIRLFASASRAVWSSSRSRWVVDGVGLGLLPDRLGEAPRAQRVHAGQRQVLRQRLLERPVPRTGGLVDDAGDVRRDPVRQLDEPGGVVGEPPAAPRREFVDVEMRLADLDADRGGGMIVHAFPCSCACCCSSLDAHVSIQVRSGKTVATKLCSGPGDRRGSTVRHRLPRDAMFGGVAGWVLPGDPVERYPNGRGCIGIAFSRGSGAAATNFGPALVTSGGRRSAAATRRDPWVAPRGGCSRRFDSMRHGGTAPDSVLIDHTSRARAGTLTGRAMPTGWVVRGARPTRWSPCESSGRRRRRRRSSAGCRRCPVTHGRGGARRWCSRLAIRRDAGRQGTDASRPAGDQGRLDPVLPARQRLTRTGVNGADVEQGLRGLRRRARRRGDVVSHIDRLETRVVCRIVPPPTSAPWWINVRSPGSFHHSLAANFGKVYSSS